MHSPESDDPERARTPPEHSLIHANRSQSTSPAAAADSISTGPGEQPCCGVHSHRTFPLQFVMTLSLPIFIVPTNKWIN